ncbi:MAG: M23 family peptidase, partial [Variovorax sp.]
MPSFDPCLSHATTRRTALLGTLGTLLLPAMPAHAASPVVAPERWPHASGVPGGVVRLSLGPSAVRPVATTDADV